MIPNYNHKSPQKAKDKEQTFRLDAMEENKHYYVYKCGTPVDKSFYEMSKPKKMGLLGKISAFFKKIFSRKK